MISDSMLLTGSISDMEWFQKEAKEFRDKFEGEFIAIKEKSIIAFAPNTDILLRKLKEKGVDDSEVIIEYVPPKNQIMIL